MTKNEIKKARENHVLNCFTDYRYNTYVVERLQDKLSEIDYQKSTCGLSSGIKTIQQNMQTNTTPWQLDLLTKEQLVREAMEMYQKEIDRVDRWLSSIKNENHRKMMEEYIIKNLCANADGVAQKCFTTSGNVCKVTHRYVGRFANSIL